MMKSKQIVKMIKKMRKICSARDVVFGKNSCDECGFANVCCIMFTDVPKDITNADIENMREEIEKL